MGYLICQDCKGYYELQPGEKPEDFIGECDCGGKLLFLKSLEIIEEDVLSSETIICPFCETETPIMGNFCSECGENICIQSEPDSAGEYSHEDELLFNKKGKTIEEHRAALRAKSKRIEAECAFTVQKALNENGYHIIKGGSGKSITILNEGIQTETEDFFSYDEIVKVTAIENKSKKKALGIAFFTPLYFYASSLRTVEIQLKDKQQILLNDVKKDDVLNCVSYINSKIS